MVGVSSEQAILLVAVGSILSVLMAFIWVAIRLGPKGRGHGGGQSGKDDIFTEEYREHLRQRGVARFEKTLDQNATFLQQDLHTIGEDVTEYIKERASEILKEEFSDQKQAVTTAQQHMAAAFAKIDQQIAEYQKLMAEQFQKELNAEKVRRLERFQQNMAEIITKHIQHTLGEQLDVGEQVQYIITNLEANKRVIIEDIKHEV